MLLTSLVFDPKSRDVVRTGETVNLGAVGDSLRNPGKQNPLFPPKPENRGAVYIESSLGFCPFLN